MVQLQSINDHLYKNMSLNTHIYTRNFDRSLFQMIEMSENSDSVWDMSPPNQIQLFNTLEEALVNINSTNLEINLELTYSFDRPKPEGAGALEQSIYLNLMDPSVVGRKLIIQKLRDAVNPHTPCEKSIYSFTIKDYYIPTIRLTRDLRPELINITELKTDVNVHKK